MNVKLKSSLGLVVMVALVVPAVVQAQSRSREDQRRRNQILVMEGVLVQAVRLGAQEVSATMEKFEPMGVTALTGTPRARGFPLEGHGIFFDVEIPNLNSSLVWSMMNVQRERQVERELEMLGAALNLLPEGPNRLQAQRALQQVTRTVGPMGSPRPGLGVQDAPPPGQVTASTVPPVAMPPSAVPPTPIPDPDTLYTEAVKSSLIDAMLDHSLQMNLGPEEWLTVAARASDGLLSPNGLSDSITIILRVRGSDLSIYHSDKTKREEILEKVKVDAKVF